MSAPGAFDATQFTAAFIEEAREHLGALETGLLALESSPESEETLGAVFRAAHSIKGGSAMLGLSAIASFTHEMESVLDQMRARKLDPTPARVGLLLRATDVLAGLLGAVTGGAVPPGVSEVVAELARESRTPNETPGPSDTAAAEEASAAEYDLDLAFSPDLLQRGMEPLIVLRDLAALGEIVSSSLDDSALPALSALEPDVLYFRWRVRLRTALGIEAIRDVLAFVDDGAVRITTLAPEIAAPASAPRAEERAAAPERAAARRVLHDGASIRVPTEKVDRLIDLVGEIVIAQSMVADAARGMGESSQRLLEAVSQMERNTRELQERVMTIRMVPIGAVLARLPRVARETAATVGKRVTLELEGEDIELDKGVVERIADPLTHLVRNAIDHGIELPEAREAAGKPAVGAVRVSAMHRGGSVVIEVTDDGRGLDLARLRAKAVERGLLDESETLSCEQLAQLVFHPGLSTAAAVTDISGRGVGMDVVKRNVEELHGSVSIETRAGEGTAMRITLPLTLAILDGLCLRAESDTYVLPLLSIVESLRVPREQVRTVMGRGEVVLVREEILPLVRLRDVLKMAPSEPASAELIVIVESDKRRVGLVVDAIEGQAQVVIKSLEANFERVEFVSGATILGDGRVGLILDVQSLVRASSPGLASNAPVALRTLAA